MARRGPVLNNPLLLPVCRIPPDTDTDCRHCGNRDGGGRRRGGGAGGRRRERRGAAPGRGAALTRSSAQKQPPARQVSSDRRRAAAADWPRELGAGSWELGAARWDSRSSAGAPAAAAAALTGPLAEPGRPYGNHPSRLQRHGVHLLPNRMCWGLAGLRVPPGQSGEPLSPGHHSGRCCCCC